MHVSFICWDSLYRKYHFLVSIPIILLLVHNLITFLAILLIIYQIGCNCNRKEQVYNNKKNYLYYNLKIR
ncbi:hypothetical protein FA950_26830 [Bacillus thuringiensis]|nr:hypothetical protein [Bacillus thuringiensis]MRC08250.1 hypothetical protein [Bacillus thuringiensis]MRC63099.1 hypothetical protein [Bacillus thuringiensis]MRC81575.1 hypothetical protein [Bacillus thuringiensis]MRD22444.1 hypothetical protein [Bacillus thuringiensis]